MKGSSGQKRRDEGPENIPKNNENLHKASRSLRGVEAAVGGEGIEEGMRTLIIRSCLCASVLRGDNVESQTLAAFVADAAEAQVVFRQFGLAFGQGNL